MADVSRLSVWVNEQDSGILARETRQKYVFAYSPAVSDRSAVSLTMPVRLESWVSRELHPVFQMNLPEGALLETIRRAIAKIIGEDDLSILRVTGGNQVGRNRFSLPGSDYPGFNDTTESLEELLTFPDTTELFNELIKRYALRSGVSGVQPKVLLEATQRETIVSSGYIVKSSGSDYPQLAANEYFCMMAAKRAGLPVPEFYLAENGGLFVMRRFDVAPDGTYLGFEDMCSLQAMGTRQKYDSTCERVSKSIKDFVSCEHVMAAREQFFAMLILSVMVRNGDSHLKNFGVLYDNSLTGVILAPVYDVITTTVYLKHDVPALSLAGARKWWPRRILDRFAMAHLFLSANTIRHVVERVADSVTEVQKMIPEYCANHPQFRDIGEQMMAIWKEGVNGLRG
ncbi:MAG: type II toxin-antitoxin system HipA family toxin [Desulfatirhabdiaceae bacterium]